jgi:acetyl esterase
MISASGSDSNSSWMSLVAGERVTPPELATLEEVIAFRSDPTRDLSRHNVDLPASVTVHEDVVLGETSGLPVRAEIYVPDGDGPFPMLQYMHGGGWCWGKALYVRKLGMSIAELGHVVVNLDYSLAPEHPFPRSLEESVYAARWMTARGAEYGGAPGPVAIGGASAGANLAAAAIMALSSGEEHFPDSDLAGTEVDFGAAVLLYGIFNFPLLMHEPGSHAGGFAETLYNRAYLGPHWLTLHRSPFVSPALAPGLGAMPPTYLTVGDQDALVPQTLDMAKRLIEHGVSTTLSLVAGLDHSFAYIPHQLPDSAAELQRLFAWLRQTTGAAPRAEASR